MSNIPPAGRNQRAAHTAPAGATDLDIEHVRTAVEGIRFGEVRVIIQDGVIVQIERVEKQRRFTPTGQSEPVASGVIQDGVYVLDRSSGPAVGPHRVAIWSRDTRPTGRRVRDPDRPKQTSVETRNAVPDRYNIASRLAVEVKEDARNRFDFDLNSERVAVRTRP
jgi:hypothetical protein